MADNDTNAITCLYCPYCGDLTPLRTDPTRIQKHPIKNVIGSALCNGSDLPIEWRSPVREDKS